MLRVLVLITAFMLSMLAASAQRDTAFNSSLSLFNNLYQALSSNYILPVDKDELTENALSGMVSKLDSWTYFIPGKVAALERARWTNKFGGIGIAYRVIDDNVLVSRVTKNSPADKAGLQAGDVLISVNGKGVKGQNPQELLLSLRGEPGSDVTLTYRRKGDPANFNSTLKREIISVSSVIFYGMLNEHFGYINLNAMTENSSEDVRSALLYLKNNHLLKGLVLDLRDNGGGKTKEADDIANLFLPKSTMTKTLKGKAFNETHWTQHDPVDQQLPLVVLVGKNTASAAEILSGILQDYDRAVIIGERTFGKAMVQKVFELGSGNEINITMAHYYMPSGRCIQVNSFKSAVVVNPSDTVVKTFRTRNGRPVKSNSAISPDIVLQPMRLPWLAVAAYDENLFFKFAANFKSTHPEIPSPFEFRIPDGDFNDFFQLLVNRNYSYVNGTDKLLDEWKQASQAAGEWDGSRQAFDMLRHSIEAGRKKELTDGKALVKNWLEREICGIYYGNEGYVQAAIKDDPLIHKAKEVLSNGSVYKAILGL